MKLSRIIVIIPLKELCTLWFNYIKKIFGIKYTIYEVIDFTNVNIVALGCLNPYYKVKLIACHFLIETTEVLDDLSSDEDEITDPSQLRDKIVSFMLE